MTLIVADSIMEATKTWALVLCLARDVLTSIVKELQRNLTLIVADSTTEATRLEPKFYVNEYLQRLIILLSW